MSGPIRNVWKWFMGCFLAGLCAVLPLAITIAIVAWVAGFVKKLVGPGTFLGDRLQNIGLQFLKEENETAAMAIGFVVVVVVLFLLGIVIKNRTKSIFRSLVDTFVSRIPIVKGVYNTASQFVALINQNGDNELAGMSVVFCTFGQENGTGLLVLMPTAEVFHINGTNYRVIYIPTSPLPMTGGLLFVPEDSVQSTDVSVDVLMSFYLSMGVSTPEQLGKAGGQLGKGGAPGPAPSIE